MEISYIQLVLLVFLNMEMCGHCFVIFLLLHDILPPLLIVPLELVDDPDQFLDLGLTLLHVPLDVDTGGVGSLG